MGYWFLLLLNSDQQHACMLENEWGMGRAEGKGSGCNSVAPLYRDSQR